MGKDRITRIDVLPAALPVKTQEDSSRGEAQQHVFLRLETEGGVVGWGEARALPSWTGETVESIAISLRDYFTPVLVGANPFARNAIMATIDEIITGAVSNGMPSAKSAVDIALYDLQGKLAGVSLHELFGGKVRDTVPVSRSLRQDSPAAMKESALRYHDSACLKVKVTGEAGLDAERVAAVHEGAPNADIWLDGNQNYSVTGALGFLERIRSHRRVVCLQQPIPSHDWFGMARLRGRSPLPIAIDEGCFTPHEALRVAQLGVADLIVLKICKAGGLWNVRRTAEAARLAGLDVLGSGLTESGVGLAAAVHIYSTLDLRLPAQLNGPQYLASLCVTGLETNGKGAFKVPSGPGLGVEVDEERLRGCVIEV